MHIKDWEALILTSLTLKLQLLSDLNNMYVCSGKGMTLPSLWLTQRSRGSGAEICWAQLEPLFMLEVVAGEGCACVPFLSEHHWARVSWTEFEMLKKKKKKVKTLKDAEENFALILELTIWGRDYTQEKVFRSIPATMTLVHSFTHSFIEHRFCTRHHIRHQKYKCKTLQIVAQPSAHSLLSSQFVLHTAPD